MSSTHFQLTPRPTEPSGRADRTGPLRAPAVVGEVLRGSGQPIAHGTRRHMEQRFGTDFSQVRVHTDARAAQSARAVDALAYTVGRNVVFGAGRYQPQSPGGERLLAHELAHVVQQRGCVAPSGSDLHDLRIGAPHGAAEAAADRSAHAALTGPGAGAGSPAAALAGPASAPAMLQRQPATPGASPSTLGPALGPVLPGLNLPTASVELAANEAISADHPQLVDLAARFKRADAGATPARIAISANLSQDAKLSSAKEQTERSELVSRMTQSRAALVALGVPAARIDLSAPTAYSTSAHGQVSVSLREASGASLLPQRDIGPPKPDPKPPGAPATATPGLADMLKLEFGPVTIQLPKSIKAKLPIKLSAAKSLVIELSAAAPAKFSFKMTLDGTPFLRVSASAGLEYDTDKKKSTGSAGLQIESVSTTCQAVNPEQTRTELTAAGVKLQKALADYSAAPTRESELSSLVDIAGALADMYDAVDKAKAVCKQVPRWKLDFGVTGPLNPDAPTDTTPPTPRPPTFLGGTLTIPF